jgi:hypothetical protein
MRRSLCSLAALVAGLAVLLVPGTATLAAPKPATTKAPKTTSRSVKVSVANAATAANLAQARRMARAKRGSVLYLVQARNPLWAKTGVMTLDQSVVSRAAIRRQGYSAHIHDLGNNAAYVHFGMIHWQTKFAVANAAVANALVAKFQANGLQAKVSTRVY